MSKSNSGDSTSWEPVGKWYNKSVGQEGLHYHRTIILPGVLRLLELDAYENPSILDLACGQGILSKKLSDKVLYTGIDISKTLIKEAKNLNHKKTHHFYVSDVTAPLPTEKKDFSHVTLILAIQNIRNLDTLLRNASKHLCSGGKFLIVMNHPCYRIPRQSSWGVDEGKKVQYRRLDRYMSPLSVPITAHPSKGQQSEQTLSFHRPLSDYFKALSKAGFVVDTLEEWCSDKTSTGGAAKIENRARDEFPLFLCLRAIKQ